MSVHALFKTSSEADEDAFSSKVLQSVLASTYGIEDIMESGVKRPIEDIDTDIEQAKKRLLVLEEERRQARIVVLDDDESSGSFTDSDSDEEKEQPVANDPIVNNNSKLFVAITFINISFIKRFVQIARKFTKTMLPLSFSNSGISSEFMNMDGHLLCVLFYSNINTKYFRVDKPGDVHFQTAELSKVLGGITTKDRDVSLLINGKKEPARLSYQQFIKETQQYVPVEKTLQLHEEEYVQLATPDVSYAVAIRGLELKKAYSLIDTSSETVIVSMIDNTLSLNEANVETAQLVHDVKVTIQNRYMKIIMSSINNLDRIIIAANTADTSLKITIATTKKASYDAISFYIAPMIEK